MHTRREFIGRWLPAVPFALAGAGNALGAVVKRPLQSVDLDFIGSQLELVRRREWNCDAPKSWVMREAGRYSRITVHHSGNWYCGETERQCVAYILDGILADHKGRNYGDIAYHFIIDAAGRLWEGRSLAYEGAHVSGQNESNVGVMLLGNFEEQRPLARQLVSLRRLAGLLRDRYMIKKHRVFGHRDLGASACPGKYLYGHVLGMRG